jgi:predicted PolB exonuclease-like 3'-5' exonuclease
MAGYRALDIETVADSSVWTPPPPKWSLCPDGDFMRLPDGTMVAAAGVRFDEPFPQPHANRVVAICWCDMSDQDGRYYHLDGVGSLCRWTNVLDVQECDHAEREMLSIFGGVEENDHALLVTWNGRSFDLPVINMRSLKHRLAMPWYYQTEGMRYRYSESGHCDLMDVLGDYGAARHMKLHVIREDDSITHVALFGRLDVQGVSDVQYEFLHQTTGLPKSTVVLVYTALSPTEGTANFWRFSAAAVDDADTP